MKPRDLVIMALLLAIIVAWLAIAHVGGTP